MGAGGGTIVGAIIGGIFGGPIGAIIGAVVGGSLGAATDSATDSATDTATASSSTTTSTPGTPAPQILAFFRLAGHLAKIDGRVSPAEANFVSGLIREIGGNDQALRTAFKQAFNVGKSYSTHSVDLYFINSMELDFRLNILEALCTLARIDDVITADERKFLLNAELIWELPGTVDAFFAYSQSHRRETPQPEPPDTLAAAYATLGCSPQDSDAAVKKAWHKKTKEYHPDLMAGRGISEETIARAEEEMKKINLAYDAIMKSRRAA